MQKFLPVLRFFIEKKPIRLYRAVLVSAFLIASVSSLARLHKYVSKVDTKYAHMPTYGRTADWIRSAEWGKETGSFLTTPDANGNLVGIENADHNGDRGPAFVLVALAHLFDVKPSLGVLVKMNFILCGLSVLLLAGTLALRGFPIIGILILIFGTPLVLPGPYPNADITGAQGGIYAMALAALLLVSSAIQQCWPKKWIAPLLIATSLGLSTWAVFMRNPIGLIGIICTFLFLILHVRPYFKKGMTFWVSVGALGVGLFIVSATPNLVLHLRDALYNVPPSPYPARHGFSHNLFVGLGSFENPWGLAWDDGIGKQYIRDRHPGVIGYSDEYFRLAWVEYFKILKKDFWIVMRIYYQKFVLIPKEVRWSFPTYLAILIAPFLVIGFCLKKKPDPKKWGALYLAAAVGMANFIIILQGILAHPSCLFFCPSQIGVWLFWLLLLSAALTFSKRFLASESDSSSSGIK